MNKNKSKKIYPEQTCPEHCRRSRRVFVGLSGGVDSAVSAALLKRGGYDVTGVFIKTWTPDFLPCTWREERRDAMRVALALDIPFLFLDFEKEYKEGVADKMIEEYRAGRTPNPDVLCNREVKFGAFWREAQKRGADYIATGHYVQLEPQEDIVRKTTEVFSAENLPDARPAGLRNAFSKQYPLRLLSGADTAKDQSYFLWTLTPEDLSHTLFPIGHLEKSEVRKLAQEFGLPVAGKKDSQGICFVGDVDMYEFLSHYIELIPGDVLSTEGEVIGRHKGSALYTIGERRGFDITSKEPDSGAYYVVDKDMEANTITVSGKPAEIKKLSPKKVILKDVNWITEPEGEDIEARIRYRGERVPVTLGQKEGRLVVRFAEPMRGLSLGQSIVFYEGDILRGGAVMDAIL